MATTTPNFGWSVPTSTDLVKDGATAIETLGDSIDASLVDLKGGTTGQILSKNSNTDMDFTWVSETGDISGVTAGTGITGGGTSGNVTITNDMATSIDAKGDLIAGTAADTYARLAVGTNGQVLTANSSTATGLEWQNSATLSNWTLLNTGGTALTAATTITVSSLSAKQMLILIDAASAGSGDVITIRFNSDTAQNYTNFGLIMNPQSTYNLTLWRGVSNYSVSTSVALGALTNNTASTLDGAVFIDLTDKTGNHVFDVKTAINDGGSSDAWHYNTKGIYEGSAAITSVSIISSGSNFDAGTIYIWGAN
jgi:hypothetical protein